MATHKGRTQYVYMNGDNIRNRRAFEGLHLSPWHSVMWIGYFRWVEGDREGSMRGGEMNRRMDARKDRWMNVRRDGWMKGR